MINLSVEITCGEHQLLFAAAIVVCYGVVAAMIDGMNVTCNTFADKNITPRQDGRCVWRLLRYVSGIWLCFLIGRIQFIM